MAQTPTRPTAPDTTRLDATIAQVVRKLDPEQIVVFGSAARQEMAADSDVDLLVIRERPNGEPETQRERWRPKDGAVYEADLVLMDRTTAEAGRASIARIQGIALEEGRTIYTRPDIEPIPTGPTYSWNGHEMVKATTFEPEEATRLLGHAGEYWEIANDGKRSPIMKCVQLQASMEHALKALTIARGERVKHKHTLNELWDDVEQAGETIRATRDRWALDVLTRYGGELQYDSPAPEHDPEVTWNDTRATGEDLLNHAKARVPKLIERTTERLRQRNGATTAASSSRRTNEK
jgi:predicted nucleotidyltransferase/HEPN domain-containing protein